MSCFINRIGETNISNQGFKMTIVGYKNSADMTIQFEDGTLYEHRAYKEFKKGGIKHPSFPNLSSRFQKNLNSRVGETNTATNGQKIKIIAYRKSNDIDVEFEDGYIAYHARYRRFKNGSIRNDNYISNKKIGEIKLATCGMKMKIIAYRKTTDIDVEFEDGTIVKNKTYSSFKLGNIFNPTLKPTYLTEMVAKNGQKMKIINFRSYNDIDVEFEDGTILKNKSYQGFKLGKIKNPNYIDKKKYFIKAKCTNGLLMEVIDYRGQKDIDIKFEDGTILKNQNFNSFKKGFIRYPNFSIGKLISNDYFGYKVKRAFTINDNVYYEVSKNNEEIGIMTLQEIYKMAVK